MYGVPYNNYTNKIKLASTINLISDISYVKMNPENHEFQSNVSDTLFSLLTQREAD